MASFNVYIACTACYVAYHPGRANPQYTILLSPAALCWAWQRRCLAWGGRQRNRLAPKHLLFTERHPPRRNNRSLYWHASNDDASPTHRLACCVWLNPSGGTWPRTFSVQINLLSMTSAVLQSCWRMKELSSKHRIDPVKRLDIHTASRILLQFYSYWSNLDVYYARVPRNPLGRFKNKAQIICRVLLPP